MARLPYPPSPDDVPDDLTAYAPDHTAREVVLVLGMLAFLAGYTALVVASAAVGVVALVYLREYHLFAAAGAVVAAVAFVFLVKGFFKRREEGKELRVEVTEEDEPTLFAFVRRLCEEAGVREPDRVFVTPDVNAGVATRATLVNLLVPPRRDLVIGLGLVNALNLSEFKAVMAHEFGHFAQGGGVAVYFATVARLCDDLVYGRDWFDRAVEGLCRSRSAGAVVGYALAGPVGAFRWAVRLGFRALAFRRHAVYRDREFHADLVAASLAGSNAIVHALYRLRFAAEALDQALADLRTAADHDLYTADVFYHHGHAADLLRRRKKDRTLGEPPTLDDPRDGRRVRVFDADETDDPADDGDYHPPNADREENVKARFVAAADDPRRTWELFADPPALRERVTVRLYRLGLKVPRDAEFHDPARVQRFIHDEHAETTYDDRYRGVFDDRLINPGDPVELHYLVRTSPWTDDRLTAVAANLYADLGDRVERRRDLIRELDDRYAAAGGRKGRQAIERTEAKLDETDAWFHALDRRAYLVFVQMAARVGGGRRAEFVERYRFHLAVQNIFRVARRHKRTAHFFAQLGFSRGPLGQDEFADVAAALRDARAALRHIVHEADGIRLPGMKNFVAGERLGDFLLPGALVKELPRRVIRGKWVMKLLRQLDEVENKARRLHFKSLGGILALQDAIAAAFRAGVRGTDPDEE